ncbi:MAG: malto-oligosyltrehalose trehalohydrolase [Deltaproteobacteria bacterium]|nr:malto-oligosyltrehalose trehalohydrolase [Deltaproteobacteria bacterium]
MQLGAIADGHGTTFRLWSTAHDRCEVRVDGATVPMTEIGGRVFEARVAGVGHGARYRFVLDGQEINDPYARFLPDGITGPAQVWRSSHAWRHEHVVRPLREHAIYELHVGTFTREGTYAAAAKRLGELVEVGFTAIEVMPVAAFGGRHGWGYDGVAHYAPHAAYGTPDELRAFIDAAHASGLSVLLDVVYNHFGPAGNVIGQYSPEYFTKDVPNVWGDAPNFRQPWMRRYVLDNVRYWLEDFRFDGLRLDAVHAIVDPSERDVLRDLASLAENVLPGALLVAEDDRNDPAIIERTGFDAAWADDFHHAVHVTLTGERDGYYACYEPGAKTIAQTITRGWLYEGQPYPTSGKPRGKPTGTLPAESLVYCLQNHDQIGNRAFGDRLPAGDKLAAATTLLLFLPMTPLVFQGEEWGASTPFLYFTDHDPELGKLVSKGRREEFGKFAAFADPAVRERIPDPQAPSTFERSKLDWDERTRGEHARMLALHTQLLRLRREDPVLSRTGRESMSAEAMGPVLVVKRWTDTAARTLTANFSDAPATSPITGPVLIASAPIELPTLPPWSAVIVATQR